MSIDHFFKVKLRHYAWMTLCMTWSLVIGNIDGSRLPDMSHFSVCVITRAQAKQDDKAYRKLKVPDQILSQNKQAFQDAQIFDPKLENIRVKPTPGSLQKVAD